MLQKMKRENRVTLSEPGPVGEFSDEALECIGDAILSYLAISQVNGVPKKKVSDMLAILEDAFS